MLIVEVADALLRYDTEVTVPLDARHAIGEVWVAELDKRRITRFADPRDGVYEQVAELNPAVPVPLGAGPGLDLGLRCSRDSIR